MKFSTKVLTLFVATTAAFSYNLPVKRSNFDICFSEIKENSTCLDTIVTVMTNMTYNKSCKIYASEKCQKFYSEVDNIPESCFDVEDKQKGLTRDGVRQLIAQFKCMCVKDENDRLCPLSDITLNHFYNPEFNGTKEEIERDSFKATEESCYSKKCTDALIEYDTSMLNDQKILEMMSTHSNGESVEDFKKYFEDSLKILTSNNCIENAGTKTPELYSDSHKDSTSDSSIAYIKMSSIIMITLSVLYYLL